MRRDLRARLSACPPPSLPGPRRARVVAADDGRGKSFDGSLLAAAEAEGAAKPGTHLPDVSAPGRTTKTGLRNAVRRRAADVRHRTRSHGGAASSASR